MKSRDRTTGLRTYLERLRTELAERPAEYLTTRSDSVSGWSIGQHYDHLLKVEQHILNAIEKGFPEERKRRINLVGRILLAIGWIPRGVAKSPERFVGMQPEISELRDRLESVLVSLAHVAGKGDALRDRTKKLDHPRFGALTAAQMLTFLRHHHRHHEKIIRDIVKAASK